MKTWKMSEDMNVSIEKVWAVIDGSEENLKKLDPHIVSQETIIETDERVGSRYIQVYREGKREETYEVVVTDYSETANKKMFEIGFTLAKMFEITARYEIEKINEDTTRVLYKTTNRPLKVMAKLMMILMPGGNKTLERHLDKIEELSRGLE